MLIISIFCYGNFQQKVLIINILLRLRMLTYASAFALVKTTEQLNVWPPIRAWFFVTRSSAKSRGMAFAIESLLTGAKLKYQEVHTVHLHDFSRD